MHAEHRPQPHAHAATTRLSSVALAAGGIGNLLEWYDFGLYGYLAPVLGRLFFPSHDAVASLIGAYAGFAVGFAMRPIGGAVLGGLLIGIAETFTVGYLSSAFSDLIVFSVLIVFMLFRSTGIRGTPVLQKV